MKEMEFEKDGWRFQHQRSALSIQTIGNSTFAVKFLGEAKSLLYTVKNSMMLSGRSQGTDQRMYADGTVVTVISAYGVDRVIIDVSKSREAEGIGVAPAECTIAFGDIATYIPPMKKQGEVLPEEVEGVDYIKTYYTYDVSKCKKCDSPIMTLQFTFLDPTGWPHYDDKQDDHCVVSQDRGCSGEVVRYGVDEKGSFVIWRVFTEGMNFNRSGLGYVLVSLEIHDRETGVIVCSTTQVVAVDCCSKPNLQNTDIYWENWQWVECASGIIFVGGSELCAVPSEISLSKLLWYASGQSGRAARFYALPEVGGCPPYEWSTTWGSIETDDPLKRIIVWLPGQGTPQSDCRFTMMIMATGRCGGTDIIRTPAPCDTPGLAEVEIGYTSLLMSCDGYQTLTASGGIPPYKWDLSGGGTLTPSSDTLEASYHSPSANADCTFNPTIYLTDCCGQTAELRLAVNCAGAGGTAYWVFSAAWGGSSCAEFEHCPCGCTLQSRVTYYNCNGGIVLGPALYDSCFVKCYTLAPPCHPPSDPDQVYCANQGSPCARIPDAIWRESGFACVACGPLYPCDYTIDKRTPAMIAAGCCPINPYTGLPF
jgi:hypothetical protein